jgi:hypothetical protein
VFYDLCDTLDPRTAFDAATESYRGLPYQTAKNLALEDVVMMLLLPLLDSLNTDGSTSISEDGFDLLQVQGTATAPRYVTSGPLNERVLTYCKNAASVIAKKFGSLTDEQVEKRYFRLPNDPEWALREYGHKSVLKVKVTKQTTKTFNVLMYRITKSKGSLRDDKLATFKRHVKEDPAVLACVVPGPDMELCSLLHQAVAGRARDLQLAEWLVKVGAMVNQPKHFYKPEDAPAKLDKQLCNYLAIHSAAKAGLADMVQLLLEFDNGQYVNVVTYHTKESLAHLVVKNGDRPICQMVVDYDAELRFKDAAGKHAYDNMRHVSFKHDILDLVRVRHENELRYVEYEKNLPRLAPRRMRGPSRSRRSSTNAREVSQRSRRVCPRSSRPCPVFIEKLPRRHSKSAPSTSAATRRRTRRRSTGRRRRQETKLPSSWSSSHSQAETPMKLQPRRSMVWIVWTSSRSSSISSRRPTSCRPTNAKRSLEIVDTLRASVQHFVTTESNQGFSRDFILREANGAERTL